MVGLLLAVLALLIPAAATAQLQTGDVYGTVTDDQNQPVPGVTVTLTGPSGTRSADSDEAGRFRFIGLYPGTYSIKAEIEGFSPVEQTGLGVRIGGKAEVQLTLSAAVREAITVVAEQVVINPREQSQGPALSQQELDKIPTARDPWSLLKQAPGVLTDRINVGGNESGQQADFFAGGATTSDNTFAVDGVILTDMAAVGGSATYYDFGAYEEVQLTTSSTDVTVQTSGVTVNQVTKRGTNTWKGDGRYLSTEGSWQSDPKEVNGNRIDQVEEYGLNFGGPLLKDHLWIWASYGESDIGIFAQGGQLDRTQLEDFNSKVNFQAGSNSGVIHYWTNDKIKNGRNAGPFYAPESTWDQTTPSDIWKIEDTHSFGSNFVLSGLYSYDDGGFTLTPKGGLDADVFIDENGVHHGSWWDFDQTGIIEQYKVDANVFASGGDWSHELKFGAGHREQEVDSASVMPRGRWVQDCDWYGCGFEDEDGNPIDNIELIQWGRHDVAVTTEYESAWAQDTFTHDRWTLSAGVRYDKQTGRNRAHSDPGNPEAQGFLPPINEPGEEANFDWTSIVPRVGVTYSLGEQRHTLVRGTFSQYAAQLGQWVVTRTDVLSPYSYVYFYFTDANRNHVFDPEERDSAQFYYLYNVNYADPSSSPNLNDPDLKPYKTNELTVSLQHAFGNNFGVSATFVYRNTTDLLDQRTLIDDNGVVRQVNADDYEVVDSDTRILPDGREVTVPIYDLKSGLSATGGFLLTNGDREIDYKGITLGFWKPPSNNWSLRGNVTWSDNKLKTGPEFRRHDDPTDFIFTLDGYGDDNDIFAQPSSYSSTKRGVALNSRWSFNLNGTYSVAPDRPWGFNLAAAVTGREGYPTTPTSGSSFYSRQLTEKIDAFRLDDVITVDARIDKEVKIGDLGLTFSLDGFNLLDEQTVLQRRNRAPTDQADLADSYSVVERLSPRVFRWGVAFHFR
jgi:hypothetical protein